MQRRDQIHPDPRGGPRLDKARVSIVAGFGTRLSHNPLEGFEIGTAQEMSDEGMAGLGIEADRSLSTILVERRSSHNSASTKAMSASPGFAPLLELVSPPMMAGVEG